MPSLPRPFTRREPPEQERVRPQRPEPPPLRQRERAPSAAKTAQRSASTNGTVTEAAAPAKPRRGLADLIFPVRPDMPEPSWSRVIGLVITMTVVWEIIWFATYYYFYPATSPTYHNAAAAWQATAGFLPFAALLAALGAVPSFWIMRSRYRKMRALQDQEQALRRAQAHQQPSSQAASNRARKRQMARRRGTGRR